VSLEEVSVIYTHRNQRVVAIENLSFSVKDKEFLSILGPSGCGKSTILHLIAGFIHPSSGNVRLNGHPLRRPGVDRGVVFQLHTLFPWKTVRENVEFGLRMKGLPKNQRHAIVFRYLEAIELTEFANSYPFELSGGMQQRVGIARAYANDPQVLLMDEPFASLDAQTAIRMRELLLRLWTKNPKTVIFVTHDIDEAILLADRVLLLSARPGKVEEEFLIGLPRPRSQDVFTDPQYVELRKGMMDAIFDRST
jgi:NitT/TauT family transport system ATP-binding protein